MSQNKVLTILGAFSPSELKKFGMYLRRTHARKEPLLQLFDALRKYHPEFDAPQLAYQELYRRILPGKKYHEKRILNEMSVLRAAAEQFMIEEYLEEHEYTRNALLLQVYKKHHLDDLFFKQLEKMKKTIDQEKETSYTWLEKMKLAETFYYHPSTERINNEVSEIYEALEHIDHFYAIAKLQYACEALNRQKVLQDSPKEIRLLEETLSHLNFGNSSCFRCYSMAHKLITVREDATYWELKAYFQSNFRKIGSKDRLIIFQYLINHISYRVKRGVKVFNRESIDLYRFGVDNMILIIDGYFDVHSFENIVAVFCNDKQFTWSLQFIKNWRGNLKTKVRKNTVTYCEAYILFEQGKFIESHQKINQNKRPDFHDDIRISLLRIRCFVELKQYHGILYDTCESFARTTRRKKFISKVTKKSVLNFLKIVQRFSKPGLNKALAIEELNKMDFVFFRTWLKEKLQAL